MPSQNKSQNDLLLANVSSAYIPEGLIAEQILPLIPVVQSTGKLGKYGTGHLRIENSIKIGRGKYRQVDAVVRSTTSYSVEGHGLEGMVTADDYRNSMQPFDAEQDEVMALTTMIALEKERVLASALGSTGTLTQNTTLSGTSQLSDYTNSDPLSVFVTGHAAVINGCGKKANVAIMDELVRNVLKFHPSLLDRMGFKYNRVGGLSDDELALALNVDKMLVASAAYETAKEGQASSLARVWGKDIIFAVCPPAAQKYQTALGYRVAYANQSQRQVYKWSLNNPPNSTAILVEDNYQFLLSNVTAAYLVKNAIA